MKKLVMFLGAALVVVGIAAMYLRQELRAQREQNTAAVARVTALESGSPGSLAFLAPGGDTHAEAGITTTSASTVLSGPAASALAGRGQADSIDAESMLAQMIEKMENSPAGQEMQRIMMRQTLEDEFPNLAKDMNLSPEKAEKLLDLLAKRRTERDTDELAGQRGSKPDRTAMAELARSRAESNRVYVAELKALLGDSYPKWNDYEIAASERRREEYARMGREQMRTVITGSGAPLTDAQFQYLNAALSAEQNRIDQETESVQQQMQRLPETNRRLVEVAAPHLNSQQLDRYRQYLKQQEEMMSTMGAMGAFLDD